jgi:hypothetical protein
MTFHVFSFDIGRVSFDPHRLAGLERVVLVRERDTSSSGG